MSLQMVIIGRIQCKFTIGWKNRPRNQLSIALVLKNDLKLSLLDSECLQQGVAVLHRMVLWLPGRQQYPRVLEPRKHQHQHQKEKLRHRNLQKLESKLRSKDHLQKKVTFDLLYSPMVHPWECCITDRHTQMGPILYPRPLMQEVIKYHS